MVKQSQLIVFQLVLLISVTHLLYVNILISSKKEDDFAKNTNKYIDPEKTKSCQIFLT